MIAIAGLLPRGRGAGRRAREWRALIRFRKTKQGEYMSEAQARQGLKETGLHAARAAGRRGHGDLWRSPIH